MYQLTSNKFDFAFRYAPFPVLVANDAHFLPTFSMVINSTPHMEEEIKTGVVNYFNENRTNVTYSDFT